MEKHQDFKQQSQTHRNKKRIRKTKFVDHFSEEVFHQTYCFEKETNINERHFQIAEELASVEIKEKRPFWREKFLDLLEDFKFVPGGRITSNAGTGLKGTTYINCFVSGFRGEDQDSMNSIMDELKRQALILKSEGGYGFCANVMRPRGGYIRGIGAESPGAVKLLEMWDTQSAVITAGSGLQKSSERGKKKIRKGAQMVTMSIWHPDIEAFVTAKQTPGTLTKFNMSVLISDEFMMAMKSHKPWLLEFPDYESHPDLYSKEWDGNLELWKSKGYKTKIYRKYEDAGSLWDIIMKATYNRNEPGVLFVDTINRWNNLYYTEHIQATNPCGEQVLPVGGVCLLGSLNLTQFVNDQLNDWNYEKLKEIIPTAVRFMDNVNDITQVPLPENQRNLKEKRRIGLGVLGYASALMTMRIRYGSPEALRLTHELGHFIMNETYRASALLAKEKGVFPLFDREKYLAGAFLKKLDVQVRELVSDFGVRNSHLLSIQPTGNSAVLANNVSGGLEPIFSHEYIRTSIQPYPPKGLSVPHSVDWSAKRVLDEQRGDGWEWVKEGDENLLRKEFEAKVWKLDKSRGLLRENKIMDYAVRVLKARNLWDPNADWAATATLLTLDEHIKTMEVFSKYIDSAISKTVNLPRGFSYLEFKGLYSDLFESGTIKGCTTYREGTMANVLRESTDKIEFKRTAGVPRPPTLKCHIHHITSKGQAWIVLVGLLEQSPYEVFVMKQDFLQVPKGLIEGLLYKETSGVYHLETLDGWVLRDIRRFFESDEQEALTRMISTALRHGADIEFIVSQLLKSEGTIHSFSKAIARTLKQYIKEIKVIRCTHCGSQNLKLEEGCFMCLDCGDSKCT